ncbi:outer membrane beta-barrel protein [Pseudomonas sp. S5(2021)]|nr:outer membrane beta-barrel protein [Pseudomonas sp. S5(2021)]
MNKLRVVSLSVLSAGALCVPLSGFAAPGDPLLRLGVLGAYNETQFDSDDVDTDDKTYLGQGGLFLDFGNKLSGTQGLIYQAGISGKYGEKNDIEVKEAQADVDLGWRFALDARNYMDVLVGAGYSWSRFEPEDNDYDARLTNKMPFAKAALGYNHDFGPSLIRFEAGARYSMEGEAKLKIDDVGSDTADLKDKAHPYAELTLLMNREGQLPLTAGVYYTRTNYQLEGGDDLSDSAELERDEYGFKVGLAF